MSYMRLSYTWAQGACSTTVPILFNKQIYIYKTGTPFLSLGETKLQAYPDGIFFLLGLTESCFENLAVIKPSFKHE